MLSFRERVLEPFFAEAGVVTRDYYDRKGLKRTTPRQSIGYDTVDKIIIDIARGLRKRSQIFDTFCYLYHCHQREDVQEDLGRFMQEGKIKPLERETVLKYEKEAIKFLHAKIINNMEIKDRIIGAIREEYGRSKNQ